MKAYLALLSCCVLIMAGCKEKPLPSINSYPTPQPTHTSEEFPASKSAGTPNLGVGPDATPPKQDKSLQEPAIPSGKPGSP